MWNSTCLEKKQLLSDDLNELLSDVLGEKLGSESKLQWLHGAYVLTRDFLPHLQPCRQPFAVDVLRRSGGGVGVAVRIGVGGDGECGGECGDGGGGSEWLLLLMVVVMVVVVVVVVVNEGGVGVR